MLPFGSARRLHRVILVLLLLVPLVAGASDYRFDGARRIVVIADVHGAYQELLSVLRETAVIDAGLHWRGGDTRLVSLGDLVDRGPGSREVLELFMRLESEARQAGGAVNVLLGNHEVMNLVGDLRYVVPADYAAFAGKEDATLREQTWQRIREQEPAASRPEFDARFPAGYFAHQQAFSPAGRYGSWLLARPFLIVVNDSAFVHGGLSPMVVELGLDATNEKLRSELAEYLRTWSAVTDELHVTRPVDFLDRPDSLARIGATAQSQALRAMQELPVFTPEGPTWYRGQVLCYPYTEADNLQAALTRLGVVRVVEGHTTSPTGRVMSRFDGRVIQLDTGMLRSYYKGSPSAYLFEGGQWSVAYADRPGERTQPEAPARAVGLRPAGLDDDRLEQWLKEAEIVAEEDLDTGVTNPHRVTLRKDGVELRAVFKTLSVDDGAGTGTDPIDVSDRFEYEPAAYKLDRMLDLDMVPVAVERAIGRRHGVLQFWVEKSTNVRRMLESKQTPAGWCPAQPQYNLMNVFDILIHNVDRTQENALWTQDWALVLIDHTRAFRTYKQNPRLLNRGTPYVSKALAERLGTLDRENLQQQLGPYLKKKQINAILQRRDRLLKEYAVQPGATPRPPPANSTISPTLSSPQTPE
jgi:Calcineurin-like phosphoesterase